MKLTAIIDNGENGWLAVQLEEITSVMLRGKYVDEI